MPSKITLIKPDDFHLHLRENQFMADLASDGARFFRRALIMPNLKNPIFTSQQAKEYGEQILSAIPKSLNFTPLMTLYLTPNTSPSDLLEGFKKGIVFGVKLYPAGATTNSSDGPTTLDSCFSVFETMEKNSIPLMIHGEAVGENVDIFDREKVFIQSILSPLIKRFPKLKITLEHITTKDAVQFVEDQGNNIAATITAHHLILNRNDLLAGNLRPHHYCMPILKREEHRQALVQAATGGNPKFFLGTDSAPHPKGAKESACGCAGIYTAHQAIPYYLELFESVGKIDRLENFSSRFGAEFHGLSLNKEKITLVKENNLIPEKLIFANQEVIPFRAGETLQWKLLE